MCIVSSSLEDPLQYSLQTIFKGKIDIKDLMTRKHNVKLGNTVRGKLHIIIGLPHSIEKILKVRNFTL